jgi:hypothetical protein
MHVHASALDALIIAAYLLVIGFLLRMIAARYKDSPFGQALAFIY